MHRLSLDSLTLTDTGPADLIRAAASAGFDLVSLWVQAPPLFPSALITAETEAACGALLADLGVQAGSLEAFDLSSAAAVESYRPALERGARLGGKTALALHYSLPDRDEAAGLLSRFAAIAADYGLAVNLEPVVGGQSQTLAEARDLILASGADVGVAFDAHHLIRAGGTPMDIAAIEPGLIRYIQLCDGPLLQPPEIRDTEAVCERLYPGEGAFPLVDMLRLLPRDVTVGIECPSLRRAQAGVSPAEQAREAIAAMRAVLAAI